MQLRFVRLRARLKEQRYDLRMPVERPQEQRSLATWIAVLWQGGLVQDLLSDERVRK